jgi:rfaE bifunctional protein nucleotidyltransferase chain/domain
MDPKNKVFQCQDFLEIISTLPRPLVMTNGVFDVLHRGHVEYLQAAAHLGATLLVAINTDKSARMLGKGPERPLNSSHDRAYVLAGLESVKYVTFFDTLTPVDLISLVRPDIYVKGGDYDMETLEETQIVRGWGGGAVSIPFVEGYSTTELVNRIRQPLPQHLKKAAFLDRDGVINIDKGYVYLWEDFEFLPGAIEGMKYLQAGGYSLVIITNQSGLARGYYSEDQYKTLTALFRNNLADQGVRLEGIYHCPHHPKGKIIDLSIDCGCRKPAPGMLFTAAKELNISLKNSVMIGDKSSDIQAAHNAGVGRTFLIQANESVSDEMHNKKNRPYRSLLECAKDILSL